MYWLDSIIIALLALGAVIGAWTGFLWQVARILSLSVSLYAAVLAHDSVTAWLQDWFLRDLDERIPHALAYVAVFIGVYVVLYQGVWLLDRVIRLVRLEPVDRLLGALVGACKVGLVLAGVCLGLSAYPHAKTKEAMEKSALAPVLAEGMEMMFLIIPEDYKTDLQNSFKKLREMTHSKMPLQARNKEADEQFAIGNCRTVFKTAYAALSLQMRFIGSCTPPPGPFSATVHEPH